MVYTHVEDLALLLKPILHPIRLNIPCLLQSHILSIIDRRLSFAIRGAKSSQSATILHYHGVIDFRKNDDLIYNRITDAKVIELMEQLQQLFCGAETSTPSVQ